MNRLRLVPMLMSTVLAAAAPAQAGWRFVGSVQPPSDELNPSGMNTSVVTGKLRGDGVTRLYAVNRGSGGNLAVIEYWWEAGRWRGSGIGTLSDTSATGLHPILAVGDPRNEGRESLYAVGGVGPIFEFRYSSGAWYRATVGQPTPGWVLGRPSVAAVRADGKKRLYVGSQDKSVWECSWTQAWSCVKIGQTDINQVFAVAAASLRGGVPRLYALEILGNLYEFTPGTGLWSKSIVPGTWPALSGGTSCRLMAAGDGRGDGKTRLYVQFGDYVHEVEHDGSAWKSAQLGGGPQASFNSINGMFIGDAGRGRNGVYLGSWEFLWAGTGWGSAFVCPTCGSPYPAPLALSDMTSGALRGDGRVRVYTSGNDSLPFEEEYAAEAAAPLLVRPNDNATVTTPNPPTLEWGAVSGAEQYDLEVSDRPDFQTKLRDIRLPNTSFAFYGEILASGTYHWRVRVGLPNAGPWSASRSFVVPGSQPPTLIKPADGAHITTPNPPTLEWGAVSGAEQYDLEVSDRPDFQTKLKDIRLPNTSFAFYGSSLSARTYYWRVRVGLPVSGSWSPSRNFVIDAVNSQAPPLVRPDDGARIRTPNPPTLEWGAVAGAEQYDLEVSDRPDFQTKLRDIRLPNTSFAFYGVSLAAGTYHWRVRVVHEGVSRPKSNAIQIIGSEHAALRAQVPAPNGPMPASLVV